MKQCTAILFLFSLTLTAKASSAELNRTVFQEKPLEIGLCRGYELIEFDIGEGTELELFKTYSVSDNGLCKNKSIISFGQDVSLNGAIIFFSVLNEFYFDTGFKGVENVSLINGFNMNCSSVACPESTRDIKAVYHNAEQGEFKMYFSLRGREYASTIKVRDFNLSKVETYEMM